jgi:hypothetical protein
MAAATGRQGPNAETRTLTSLKWELQIFQPLRRLLTSHRLLISHQLFLSIKSAKWCSTLYLVEYPVFPFLNGQYYSKWKLWWYSFLGQVP